VAIGMFIATIGYALGLDAGYFRIIGAVLLMAIGLVLLVPALQTGGFATTGLRGQFALGLLLGAVWSPCVGPTLGAASMLASRGEDLGQVSLVMGAFGVGAALPLLVLGLLSREAMMAWRGRLLNAGKAGKMALGGLLLALGLMIASGLDKRIETFLVDASPAWLTELTTWF
jgi:cytochrome c biogenesis protein CcdA